MLLYVATSNPGKLRDFARAAETHLAAGEPIHIQPLPNLAAIPAPPEDEPTFEGNARAKALYYASRAPGHLVLADDSGLEVTCLDNAPGVRSARYAEDRNFPAAPASTTPAATTAPAAITAPAATTIDERNNAALLRALHSVPELCRQARYRCVLALARQTLHAPAEVLLTAEGSVEGRILTAPQGTGGFGYDPLFFLPELAKTMAEIDPTTRLELSHRGQALRTLLRKLGG